MKVAKRRISGVPLSTLALGLVVAACAPTGGELSFDAAVADCTAAAITFGKGPWSNEEQEPPEHAVQDRYRACVHAKSGRYPDAPVIWREVPRTSALDAVQG